jgi:copper chaperone CopZ
MKTIFRLMTLILVMGLTSSIYAQNSKSELQTVNFKASVHCQSCKDKIESGLAYEKGVKSSSVNLDTKIVTVVFNPKKTGVETIKAYLMKLGYTVEEVKGSCCGHDGAAGGCSGKSKEKSSECKH